MALRIQLAQLNPIVGDFDANVKNITAAYRLACTQGARLLLTPELAVCGYPPGDLLERVDFLSACDAAVSTLAALTEGENCALLVGHIAKNANSPGKGLRNQITLFEKGQVSFFQSKCLLPDYDVFSETRHFDPGFVKESPFWNCDGYQIALAVCEDLWGSASGTSKPLYANDPVKSWVQQLEATPIDCIISVSASPYEIKKYTQRIAIHQGVVKKLKAPLIYLNQTSATDELLFDGGSFVLNSQADLLGRLPFFKVTQAQCILEKKEKNTDISLASELPVSIHMETLSEVKGWRYSKGYTGHDSTFSEIGVLAESLIFGIREYFKRTGFKKAILGLSGGIDSAVVATLAVQALGPTAVLGVAMPGPYSSKGSWVDAEALARVLGIRFEVHSIRFLFSTLAREWSANRQPLAPIALENLQARLRGMLLMTLSNHESSLVLSTGNKSELALGYCTLYGDLNGALAPLGDLFKTKVYELAHYLNDHYGHPIPQSSLTKPPSAELRPHQTDQDSLPPYEVLDTFLSDWLEQQESIATLEERYGQKLKDIPGLLRRIDMNEYKRKQAPLILKVSPKAFGIGRRIPVAQRFFKL